MNLIPILLAALTAAAAIAFLLRAFDPNPARLPPVYDADGLEETPHEFHRPAPMTRRDLLPLAAILLGYSLVAFVGLGNTRSPESWQHFAEAGEAIELRLAEPTAVSRLQFFCGPDVGRCRIWRSADGVRWDEAGVIEQDYVAVLKWQELELSGTVLALRCTAEDDMHLGELALRDAEGRLLPLSGGGALTDEQALTPERESFLNSSYFDEIYHVRTAWEHLEGVQPYEITHPPLGKLILGLGIRLFGMTPFGWRFSGVLFGILMLPLLYVFLKNLFGRTLVASCVTLIFAFDCMHFAQTRIATIDTYSVFFILWMYYFFYRYFTQPYDTPLRRTLLPLALSGLGFALGTAAKWTVILSGGGLALLWLLRQILRLRWARRMGRRDELRRYLLPTVGWSCVFFLGLPALAYLGSYVPYARAAGTKLLSLDYLRILLDNIDYMYHYHAGLEASHPYQSPFWQWMLDIRPILYYLHYFDDGTRQSFGAFGNPLFWWTGLGAIAAMAAKAWRRDGTALLIVTGYLSCLLPWIFVERCAFIYHYFPSTVFLALALGRLCSDLCDRAPGGRSWRVPALAGGCLLLFALLYPAVSGVRIPLWYGEAALHWLGGSWPF